MNPDLQRILENKATHRRKLADLPIGEKLRLLDAMREGAIASLEDSENLPAPALLAAEIVESLEAALEEFRAVEEALATDLTE